MRFFVLLIALLLSAPALTAQSKYFDISKNLEIFINAYKELNHSYVDELEPGQVMRLAMDAMLGGMDPYTNYYSETDIEGFRIQSEGKYSGLGAQGKRIGEYVVITDMHDQSPAQRAGLKIGDAILAVENQDAKGRTEEEVLNFIRGFPGTEIDLLVRRPGEKKDMKIRLKRDEVNVPNVPHSGLVAENIGYINLSTFTENAADNVAGAFTKLKEKNPKLKGVILDLRDNGGGLLNEAVSIVNIFVPRGELVVSTKGKAPEQDRSFRTPGSPMDTEIPVVVLINKWSASASEIVSGALQDLDRAVLVGQRSYGKGLVQNVKEIGYNSRMKLTISKYYIPSGRCIQAVRYKNGAPVDIPDTERAPFKTRNGRTVLDGGGVKPDIVLPADTAMGYVKALLDQHLIFNYATQYALQHPTIDSAEAFVFTDWDGFARFIQGENFNYVSASEKKLEELRLLAAAENLSLSADIQALENKIKADKKNLLTQNKARIIRELEQEIVGRYYLSNGRVRKSLRNDPEIGTAVELLNDPARYRSLLGVKG